VRWVGWWTRARLGETPRPCGRTYHISLPRSPQSSSSTSSPSSPASKKETLGYKNCLMFPHKINKDICMWIVQEEAWTNGLWNYTNTHTDKMFHTSCIVGKKRDHGILDPMIFLGKIRKNRKSSEKYFEGKFFRKLRKDTKNIGKIQKKLEKIV